MNLFSRKKERITIECGKTFAWRRGLSLEATEDSAFLFPGAIVQDGETIGGIIEASDDDMQIGFEPNPNGPGFQTITIVMKYGQSVTLHRSSEVMHAPLTQKDKHPKEFVVLKR
jgi:hypothetical protein